MQTLPGPELPRPGIPRPAFPRLPLIGIFALLVFAIGAAVIGRMTHAGVYVPEASQVSSRELLFLDRDDGAVVVLTPERKVVQVFTGEQGFLRGTLRGFARTRHQAGLGSELPFQLARWTDGRLTIDDPATGQHVELLAFGPTNAGVFAPLLETRP